MIIIKPIPTTHPNQLILVSFTFFLTLTITIPIDGLQIPFLPNLNPPSSIDPLPPLNFQLQQAVHITTHRSHRLRLRRTFDASDRESIDLRSINSPTPTARPPLASDQLEPPHYYPSSHHLKLRHSKLWSHRSSLQTWKLAHQRQILISRAQRNQLGLDLIPSSSLETLSKNVTLMNSRLDWQEVDTVIPDVTDIETLASLAKMTNNAYSLPGDDRWYDPGGSWNLSDSFGWQEDGLRGHVFATPDNSTVVIAIKGTSAGILGNGGSTGTNDKLNDNLLFSCCCARVSWSWSPVCDCYAGSNRCKETCVENALIDRSVYFQAAIDLYDDIVRMYPHSQIWLAGHSLGAALAGLLGVTFGVPAVGFEAPGDLLAAKRLHLPLPPGGRFGNDQELSQVYQVFHTADPIAMGTCNGALSSCSVAGYALETRCHLGKSIIFDTVGKLNWAQDIRTHPIQTVIEKILRPDWMPKSISTHDADQDDDCRDSDDPRRGLFASLGFRWRWPGRKHSKLDNCTHEEEPIVPVPQAQNCEGGDCQQWEFGDSWNDDDHPK